MTGGRRTRAALIAAALALPRLAAASEPGDRAAAGALVFSWQAPGDTRPRAPDHDGDARLREGEVLAIPVSPSRTITVLEADEVGLGSGDGDAPDVVRWLGRPKPGSTVRVPAWDSARFVVLRGAHVRFSSERERGDAMEWHRLDEAVGRWLLGGSAPERVPEQARALVSWLAAARATLAEDAAPWLAVRYLESAALLRPLTAPFAYAVTPRATGGHPVAGAPDARRIERGESLSLRGGDVLTVTLRAATGRASTRVRVYEGERLRAHWAHRSPHARREGTDLPSVSWTRRFPVASAASTLRVVVDEGAVVLEARGSTRTTDVLDVLRHLREPTRWAERATTTLGRAAARAALGDPRALVTLAPPRDARDGLLRDLAEAHSASTVDARAAATDRALARLAVRAAPGTGELEADLIRQLATLDESRRPPSAAAPSEARLVPHVPASEADAWRLAARDGADGLERAVLLDSLHGRGRAPWALEPARWLLRTTTRWEALAATAQHDAQWTATPASDGEGGRCALMDDGLARWMRVDARPQRIDVTAPPGSYARLSAAILGDAVDAATITVDEQPLHLHPAAAARSLAVLSPGPHTIASASSDPVWVRVAQRGDRPCDEVASLALWHEAPASFALPPAAHSIVALHARLGRDAVSAELRVRDGARTTRVSVRAGATGHAVVPVGASGIVSVESDAPVSLRALVRAPRGRSVTSAAIDGGKSDGDARAESPSPPLDRLRRAARALSDARDARSRHAARARQAVVLEELGYGRMAAMIAPAAEPAEVREGAVDATPFVRAPYGAAAVAPVGLLARIAPLPVGDRATARRAQAALRAGDFDRVVRALAQRRADATEETLQLAVALEGVGLTRRAAQAFEVLGRSDRAGAYALVHAASLLGDAAASEHDESLVLPALALVAQAEERGASVTGVRARLEHAVRWRSPSWMAYPSVAVARTRAEGSEGAGVAMRRALVDAPDDAVVIAEGHAGELVVSERAPSKLTVERRCVVIDGSSSTCSLPVHVDGAQAHCPRASEPCALALAPGKHRIEVGPSEHGAAIGWMRARRHDGSSLEARAIARYVALREGDPLTLSVLGPTVIKVEARRADASIAATLRAEGADGAIAPLPAERDGDASYAALDDGRSLGAASEATLRVAPGPQRVTLRAEGGPVAARLVIAHARGTPLPRAAATKTLARDEASGSGLSIEPMGSLRDRDAAQRDEARGIGLSLGAELSAATPDVSFLADNESRGGATQLAVPFGEARLYGARALAARRLWVGAALFGRARSGSESAGGEASVDLLSRAYVPGVHGSARGARQAFFDGAAFGAQGRLELYEALPVAPRTTLAVFVAGAFHHVDAARAATEGVDPIVYAPYGELAPWHDSAGLRAIHRPFVDTLVRASLSARHVPRAATLDRVDASLAADTLPGRGWAPWLALSYRASARPESALRVRAFVRHSVHGHVTAWRWTGAGSRLRAEGDVNAFVDTPARSTGPGISAMVLVAYDWLVGRGTEDLTAAQAPFRERMAEGSRGAPPSDAAPPREDP